MPLFVQTEQVPWSSPLPGVKRVDVTGQGLLLSLAHVQPGFSSPPERHAEEQVNVILQGTMEWVLGDQENEVFLCGPGSILIIEPDMPHSNRVIGDEEVVILHAFAPPRQALLAGAITLPAWRKVQGR